ncbi:hypothetical protein QQP08_015913 [Theobroma cacao]|nr:hypothetical protein QQP08_015913 [Theobroma cacao]
MQPLSSFHRILLLDAEVVRSFARALERPCKGPTVYILVKTEASLDNMVASSPSKVLIITANARGMTKVWSLIKNSKPGSSALSILKIPGRSRRRTTFSSPGMQMQQALDVRKAKTGT